MSDDMIPTKVAAYLMRKRLLSDQFLYLFQVFMTSFLVFTEMTLKLKSIILACVCGVIAVIAIKDIKYLNYLDDKYDLVKKEEKNERK